jgi:hypothetical protein
VLEVLAVPVEDLRDLHLPRRRIVAVAAAVGEEAAHGVLELRLEALGDERLVAQHRAADRGAHHRDVHARLVVHALLAQHPVLDSVEVHGLAEEREELVLPRIVEDRPEIADRADVRIAREDLLDGEGVVRVHEEGFLLRLRPRVEFGARHLLEIGEHGLQRRMVACDAGIVHARGVAAREVAHMLLEQRPPGGIRVIERRGGEREAEGGEGEDRADHFGDSVAAGSWDGLLSARPPRAPSTAPKPPSPRVHAL